MEIEVIGVVHSCFHEKFGIPRQPGLVRSATGQIELFAPFDRSEMVRGLEYFSHIWLLFLFHRAIEEGWRPTTLRPLLGGQKLVGVFGCRTPHRPNFIGMSALRLESIVLNKGACHLEVSGVDLLDGTPVIDIKPYISYSDSLPLAEGGFPVEALEPIPVQFSWKAERFCREYYHDSGRDLAQLITEVLQQDPRPANQRNKKREFGMLLWDVNIRYSIQQNCIRVNLCQIIDQKDGSVKDQ